jgi:hypothetical protein
MIRTSIRRCGGSTFPGCQAATPPPWYRGLPTISAVGIQGFCEPRSSLSRTPSGSTCFASQDRTFGGIARSALCRHENAHLPRALGLQQVFVHFLDLLAHAIQCQCGKAQATAHLTVASTIQPNTTTPAKPIVAQAASFDRDSSSAATVGRIISTAAAC